MTCPFCAVEARRIIYQGELTVAVMDGFPVSPGHTLIIPRRHIASLFEATTKEQLELLHVLSAVRTGIMQDFHPDGFNIGINDGGAAGQTVMHLHIHLIPRYKGDQPDPRGGVRWIFPDKAAYWKNQ